MSKLKWSAERPNKEGLWAYSVKQKDDHNIDGIFVGLLQVPIRDDWFYCYLGPIPLIDKGDKL